MAPRKRTKIKQNTCVSEGRANDNNNSSDDLMDVDVEDRLRVRIKTSDGKRFTLNGHEVNCSNTLRMMMESFQQDPNSSTNSKSTTSNEYIALKTIHSQQLSKIIEWCQKHTHNDAMNNNDDRFAHNRMTSNLICTSIVLDDWDKNYLNSMDDEELFKLMHAANYLDIRTLLDALCQTVAKNWEGKKVEDIRKMYNLENDFEVETEHQMMQENKRIGLSD